MCIRDSLWCTHALFQNHLFKVQRHFEVILSSMWYVLVRDTARQCMPLTHDTDASQHCVKVVVAHCRPLYCSSFLVFVTTVWRNNSANNHKGSQLVFSCFKTTTTTNKQRPKIYFVTTKGKQVGSQETAVFWNGWVWGKMVYQQIRSVTSLFTICLLYTSPSPRDA